jgi:hypothetical protein
MIPHDPKRRDAADGCEWAISGQGRLRLMAYDRPFHAAVQQIKRILQSIFRNLNCGIAEDFYQSRVTVALPHVFLT